MPRFLAVDWDGVEVRFVFGNQNKDKLSVAKIGAEPLMQAASEAGPDEVPAPTSLGIPQEVGPALLRLLQSNRVPAGKTFFALGAGSAEAMYFTLPPSKDEEIPELLKNQALRDMPNFSESYVIDFLPLGTTQTGPRKVLAVAQSRMGLRAIQTVGKTAHRKPDRIEYRAAAATSFVLDSGLLEEAAPPLLVVNALADELDLIVVKERKIVYIRSVKLPDSGGSSAKEEKIFQEITRTSAVGLQDISDEPIESVLFLAGEDEFPALIDRLHHHSLDVRTVDPLETARVQIDEKPRYPGRYAALLGMMLLEASGKKPAVDLLHPKSKPLPPNIAGIVLLSILLFGLLVGGLYYWNRSALAKMTQHQDEVQKKYDELLATHNQWSPFYRILFNASTFDTSDAIWLDTIRDIAPYFPEQQDMVVHQMEYRSGPITGIANGMYYSGRIDISAMVRDPVVIQTLKYQLESKRMYTVFLSTPTQNPAGGGYPWNYRFTIGCFKVPDPKIYLQFLPEELQTESTKNPETYQKQ